MHPLDGCEPRIEVIVKMQKKHRSGRRSGRGWVGYGRVGERVGKGRVEWTPVGGCEQELKL